MKTRRRSRVSASAVAEQEIDADSSQAIEEALTTNAALTLTLPEDIDTDSLSNILPDLPLTSISPEAVILLYKTLLSQALQIDTAQRELDQAHAEAERKDVELDQALQDREGLSKDLETSFETAHAELSRTKQERDELGTCRFQRHLTLVLNGIVSCISSRPEG
jgi:nucleoprotein TPR